MKFKHLCSVLFSLGSIVLLSGCQLALLDPKGVIASSEKHLLIDAILLMLIVVIPVIILSLLFAWRYRRHNTKARYSPEWGHSNLIEVICWTIPCIIILVLATVTWISSHKLDPYRPLNMKHKPLVIQAISLDWKWLFIYPTLHIATVNFVQFPVHQQVQFLVTSDAPMNSLEIPRLAGQIYAMTGMQTKLHLMADQVGEYRGLSTNYSGLGFAGMNFVVKVSTSEQFTQWVEHIKRTYQPLTMGSYHKLVMPSLYNKPKYFSLVPKHLFNCVIMKYMKPKSMKAKQIH